MLPICFSLNLKEIYKALSKKRPKLNAEEKKIRKNFLCNKMNLFTNFESMFIEIITL